MWSFYVPFCGADGFALREQGRTDAAGLLVDGLCALHALDL